MLLQGAMNAALPSDLSLTAAGRARQQLPIHELLHPPQVTLLGEGVSQQQQRPLSSFSRLPTGHRHHTGARNSGGAGGVCADPKDEVNCTPGVCGAVWRGTGLWNCVRDKFAPRRGISYRHNLLQLSSFCHVTIIFPVIPTDCRRKVAPNCLCQRRASHFFRFDSEGGGISFQLGHSVAMVKPKPNKALPRNHNTRERNILTKKPGKKLKEESATELQAA